MHPLTVLRKERGLTQKQLAQMLNVAQNTVSNWENGLRNFDNTTLCMLAECFGVSTDWLLGLSADLAQSKRSAMLTRLNQTAATLTKDELMQLIALAESMHAGVKSR